MLYYLQNPIIEKQLERFYTNQRYYENKLNNPESTYDN